MPDESIRNKGKHGELNRRDMTKPIAVPHGWRDAPGTGTGGRRPGV